MTVFSTRFLVSGMGALFLTAAGFFTAMPAAAGPHISAATHDIHVQIDGITMGREGVEMSLFKTGRLVRVSEAKPMAPREKCPAGNRLTLTGTTIVCRDSGEQLLDWYKKVLAGTTDRKSVSIIMRDRTSGEVLRTYNLFDCFPTSYSRVEPDDCDDTDDSLVAVEIQVGVVEIEPSSSSHKKDKSDIIVGHNFRVDIDGCVSGGQCPGRDSDVVEHAALEIDVAGLVPGGASSALDSAHKFTVRINDSDDNDALCGWVLRAQGSPIVVEACYVTVNTTRSNIKSGGKAPAEGAGAGGTLVLTNVRLKSVELPTFDFSPDAAEKDAHMVEEMEFVVERIERA